MRPNHRADPVYDCDAIQTLIPDYAFGLTDPAETRVVEANLVHCPEAATQLADYRQVQNEMRVSVPQIEPPIQLNDRLMAQERALLDERGLPGRPWFKHLIYAPLPSYEAVTMPGLRVALEKGDMELAREQAARLAEALDRAVSSAVK